MSDDALIARFVHGLKPALLHRVFRERIRVCRVFSIDKSAEIADDIERSECQSKPNPQPKPKRPNASLDDV